MGDHSSLRQSFPVSLSCAGHVFRIFDLSDNTFPKFGEIVVLRANKVAMEKMAIINTFEPVLINGWWIGYMLADDSWMNRTR